MALFPIYASQNRVTFDFNDGMLIYHYQYDIEQH